MRPKSKRVCFWFSLGQKSVFHAKTVFWLGKNAGLAAQNNLFARKKWVFHTKAIFSKKQLVFHTKTIFFYVGFSAQNQLFPRENQKSKRVSWFFVSPRKMGFPVKTNPFPSKKFVFLSQAIFFSR